jgi:hypothetical protein
MNADLARLLRARLITKQDAFGRSPDPEGLEKLL